MKSRKLNNLTKTICLSIELSKIRHIFIVLIFGLLFYNILILLDFIVISLLHSLITYTKLILKF